MAISQTYLHDLTFALGEQSFAVEDSAAAGRTISSHELLRDAGFKNHHICEAQTQPYELAQRALTKIENELQNADAIVYSTCLPFNANIGSIAKYDETKDVKHLMDFPAGHLQSDFRLHNAQIFGLNQQACTGMLGSIRMASMLLNCEPEMAKILCITADRFPPDALYEQAYCLISDGAAGCIVSRQPQGFRIVAAHAMTNGALALASDDETIGTFFNYSHATITHTLKKAHLSISDIDWVIPQNTNRKAWRILASLLGLPEERVLFPTLEKVGHVISGDNIINLLTASAETEMRSGDRLLLFMAGYGLNWQCLIIEKV